MSCCIAPRGELFAWRREDGDRGQYLKHYRIVQDDRVMTILRVY